MRHVVGIAWFRADQWNRLRDVSSDRDHMEADYEDWRTNAEKQLAELRLQGLEVRKIHVDLDEFVAWCKSEKLGIDASSRSRYASYRLTLDDSQK
jgi:hypothetical protein